MSSVDNLMLGGILGDGSIKLSGNSNVVVSFGHGYKQLYYLEWKYNLVKQRYNVTDIKRYVHKENGGVYYQFSIRSCPELKFYKDLFYSEGVKTLTNRALELMKGNWFALAVWFMDDGTLDPLKRNFRPKARFCVGYKAFNVNYIKLLESFGFKVMVGKLSSGRYRLSIGVEGTYKLGLKVNKIISSVGMDYKVVDSWGGPRDYSFRKVGGNNGEVRR